MLKKLYLFGWKAITFLVLLFMLLLVLLIIMFKILFIIFPIIILVFFIFLFSKRWFKKTNKRKNYVDAKYQIKN